MRLIVLAAALATVAAPAFAGNVSAPAPAVAHVGDMLRDANNVRLSSVDSVNGDGSVSIIYNDRVITIPATSLSTVDGKLVTSLTKAQVRSM